MSDEGSQGALRVLHGHGAMTDLAARVAKALTLPDGSRPLMRRRRMLEPLDASNPFVMEVRDDVHLEELLAIVGPTLNFQEAVGIAGEIVREARHCMGQRQLVLDAAYVAIARALGIEANDA